MIDVELSGLVTELRKRLDSLGAPRPSQVLAAKEACADRVAALLNRSDSTLSQKHKVAAFDALATTLRSHLVETVQNMADDTVSDDINDQLISDLWTWILGPLAQEAIQQLETFFN